MPDPLQVRDVRARGIAMFFLSLLSLRVITKPFGIMTPDASNYGIRMPDRGSGCQWRNGHELAVDLQLETGYLPQRHRARFGAFFYICFSAVLP